jgi:hypothetical protein
MDNDRYDSGFSAEIEADASFLPCPSASMICLTAQASPRTNFLGSIV